MKQTMPLLALLALCLTLPMTVTKAEEMQSGLKIQDVFQQYGKKRNVTMVELSTEMLETYGMTHYKSIAIKEDPSALAFVRRCLDVDRQGARTIKEVVDAGGIVSAYYQLPGNAGLNRFILFRVNRKRTVTLVYIEGDMDSEDLITILFAGNKDI
jgi:hypothetical protein